jgi:lysozyme
MVSYSPNIIARAVAQASGIIRAPGMEGCVLTAYPDPATGGEPWTAGWGSTTMIDTATGQRRAVRRGDVFTQAQADAELLYSLENALDIVIAATVPPLNGDQLGALTSFVYNIGRGEKGVKDGLVRLKSGGPSTLLMLTNQHRFDEGAGQFGLWDLGDGKVMPGLARRRAIERDVYLGKLDMTSAVIPASWRP